MDQEDVVKLEETPVQIS